MRSEESIKKEIGELEQMANQRANAVVMADCQYIAIVNRKKALEDVLAGDAPEAAKAEKEEPAGS